jgi:hypothetical protein
MIFHGSGETRPILPILIHPRNRLPTQEIGLPIQTIRAPTDFSPDVDARALELLRKS